MTIKRWIRFVGVPLVYPILAVFIAGCAQSPSGPANSTATPVTSPAAVSSGNLAMSSENHYYLRPFDTIAITVQGDQAANQNSLEISPGGMVELAFLDDPILLKGLTTTEASQKIADTYKRKGIYANPQIDVSIKFYGRQGLYPPSASPTTPMLLDDIRPTVAALLARADVQSVRIQDEKTETDARVAAASDYSQILEKLRNALSQWNAAYNDYVLRPGDTLRVYISGDNPIARDVPIASDGTVSSGGTPGIPGQFAGLKVSDAAAAVARALANPNVQTNPQVIIFVKEYAPRTVTFTGQVAHPGPVVLPVTEPLTAATAFNAAGGPTGKSAKIVTITRPRSGQPSLIIKANMWDCTQDSSKDVPLQDGDTVDMPESWVGCCW
jgi:protein involved in polysaccharide export with SLBB domain